MFGMSYLPEKDIARQMELQDELKVCRDSARAKEIADELAKLQARRKPIIECNLEETNELKSILYKKFEMVSKIGKNTQAKYFFDMIRILNDRIAVLHLEDQKKAENEFKEKEETSVSRKEEAKKEIKRGIKDGDGAPKARSGRSRWTAGLGKID